MDLLFSIGSHNAAIMAILVALVWSITRIWKNAPAAHLLWLLVLVKLVTPPAIYLDIRPWTLITIPTATPSETSDLIDVERSVAGHDLALQPDGSAPNAAEPRPARQRAPSSTSRDIVRMPADAAHTPITAPHWETVRSAAVWICLIVAGLFATQMSVRVVRFQGALSRLLPAPEWLQSAANDLAKRMGLKTSAAILQAETAIAPFVWCFASRAIVVVPRRLTESLNERQLEMVLAHELAHLRRRDHWVRIVELAISILYWWNPLVWGVRKQLHAAEEACCDAWVAWLFPDQCHLYAETLLKSAEAVDCPSLVMISPFLNKHTLKARVELVLSNRSQRTATRLTVAYLGLVAGATLPIGVSALRGEVERQAKAELKQSEVNPSEDAGIVVGHRDLDSSEAEAGDDTRSPSSQVESADKEPAASKTEPTDPAKELASFQGVWSFDVQQLWDWPPPIGIGTDGKGRNSEKRWVVNGNRITWTSQEGERILVSFTIDPSKKPKEIDFKFLSGPHKGEKSLGIYEPQMGNDHARWLCMTNPGTDAPRPTDVSASGFKRQTMIGMHQVVPPETPPVAAPLERFQGTLMMQLCDSMNRTLSAPQEEVWKWHWVVKGDQILWSRQGQEWKLTLKADPSKKPKEIDLTYVSGPFQGTTCLGMYEWGGIDGKSLMISIQDPGTKAPRPTGIRMTSESENSLIFLRPTAETDTANELTSLQGTWTLRNYDTDSWPLPGGKGPDKWGGGSELRWTVRGHEISWISRSGEVIRALFTIDPSKSPKHLNLKFLTGPNKDELCPGLYQRGDLDENILWICIADPGSNAVRPNAFSYRRGAGHSMLSLYPARETRTR